MLSKSTLYWCTLWILSNLKVHADRHSEDVDETGNRQCGVYFAPSSSEGAGWGVFSGRNVRQNSIVGGSSIAILLTDLDRYNGFHNPQMIQYDYFWMPDWANQWYEARYAESFVPGIGKNLVLCNVSLIIGQYF